MSNIETLRVDSSLGTPYVRFNQTQDFISRGARRSMSSSRCSSISSRSTRNSRARSSGVDSTQSTRSSQYSCSTASHGPKLFAIDTNSNKNSKHPVTVALTKDVKDRPFVMRILLDPCCTGTELISAKVANSLGLNIRPATYRETYTSVAGKFNTY